MQIKFEKMCTMYHGGEASGGSSRIMKGAECIGVLTKEYGCRGGLTYNQILDGDPGSHVITSYEVFIETPGVETTALFELETHGTPQAALSAAKRWTREHVSGKPTSVRPDWMRVTALEGPTDE